ncbi:MAG: outer membrane protein assembly factor [Acidobacteriota bacterium]
MRKFPASTLALSLLAAFAAAGPAAASAPKLKVNVEGLGGALGGVLENYSLKGSDLKQNVLSILSIEEARKSKDLTETRILKLHKEAPDEIRRALEPFGYYQPTIVPSLTHEGDTWTALYRVDPGTPLRVTSLDLRITGAGAQDPAFQSASAGFPLHQGDVVVSPAYERGKEAIETAAAEHGYLDAAFSEKAIRVDLARYTADVVIHYDTGPRYLFGPVRFDQSFLDPRVVQGYVTWKQGEPLNVQKLLELQNGLSSAPYFRRVEVVPAREEAQGLEVPIVVTLVAAKPRRYQFGAGYGTDTGPRGTATMLFRRVNRHGDHADVTARLSGIEQSVAARYQIPGPFPRTDVVTLSVGYAHLNPTTSNTRAFVVGGDRSQMRWGWRESLSLFYHRETYTIGVDKGTSNLLVPGSSWERVIADDRIDTHNGYRLRLLVQGAAKGVLSNATFLQADVTGKYIRSLSPVNRLIVRGEVGDTATGQFHQLPPIYRFFAGGDQSVRGYGYQRIGPLDEQGHVIGGKVLTIGSLEFEHRFLPKWGAAAFVDAGTAANTFGGNFRKGAGVGIRWISPIGPVRIDGGYGFDAPSRGMKLYVNIGPDL